MKIPMIDLLKSWIPFVALILLVSSFSACKKGGGGITDPVEPTVDEPKMTISFEGENTSFLPGEFIRFVVSNTTLEEDSYKATIDNSLDVELPLYEDDKSNQGLIFIIPEIEAGNHTLYFNKVGIDTTLAFSIDDYEPIDNPDKYVEDFLVESKSSLEHLIQATTSEGVKDTLQTMLMEIDEAVSSMDQLSEEERKLIARFLETNLESTQSAGKQKFSAQIESCEQKMELITPDMAVLVTTIASWGYATYLASTISWTGWGAVASGVFLSATGAAILIKLNDTLDRREDLINSCFEPFETWLDETFKAKDSGIPFEHGKAKSFNISSEYDLPQTVYSLLSELKEIYSKVQSIIPDSWIEKASKLDYKEVRSENPTGFNVDTISDERILGAAAENGDQLAITLEYQKRVILDGENNPFTFELIKDGYNQSITAEATLKPLVPITYDKQVTIVKDSTSVSDTLEADYAADFIIESPPSNGTVTLDNVFTGEFTYRADEGYTGDDSFTFSASNSTDSSESSTIFVRGSETYELQTGDYNPNYDLIKPATTILPGDDFAGPNYVAQMVRLTLNGEPVKVGSDASEWAPHVFGDIPTSEEDVEISEYEVKIYDYTNQRDVNIKLGKLTLTNEAYSAIVGKTVKVTPYRNGEPADYGNNPYTILQINSDGTYYQEHDDGSGATTSSYDFIPFISPSFIQCSTYLINKAIVGAIEVNASLNRALSLKTVLIYKDGTLGAYFNNTGYGCYNDPDQYNAIKVEYIN